ncbi:MAG: FtsK/SpoIIIE domain-containing protein [Actinomycetota bacterium]|nr:FtsK/SpoIIIE domain-containing protein [Actinomycetota bacterium]
MELLLTVSSPTSFGLSRADVAVELDPFTSVGLLGEALAEFARRRGTGEAGPDVLLAVVRDQVPTPLDPEMSVFEAGLVSGDEVRLIEDSAARRPAPDGRGRRGSGAASVSFDITSGPEAGRTVVIGPGRHVVGRSLEADVVVDDPTMSRQHLTIEVSKALAVVIHPNPEATNGTFLGTVPLSEPHPLAPEEAIFAGSSQLVLRAARLDSIGTRDRLGQIAFNRRPYRQPIVHERVLGELDPPPERPGQRRFSFIAVLVPLVAALVIVALTRRIEFLIFAGLSPLMMVSNHFSEGRYSKRSYATDRETFLARVEARAGEVDQALAEEREERLAAAPDVPMLARHAAGRLGRLWERHRGTPDFLHLRLGLGRQPTRIVTSIRSGGDPELREAAEQRLAHHKTLSLVPVVVSLDDAGITGLYGDPEQARALATSLLLQAVVLHSPEDLVIAAAVPATDEGSWSWLKWLPHTRSATSPLEGPHLVDEAGTDDLLLRLMAVANARAGQEARARAWPRVLLLLHHDARADGARLAALLDVARPAGIVVVWIGHEQHQLPRQCRAIVGCVAAVSGESQLRFTDPTVEDQTFELEGMPVGVAGAIARSLAPVRDVSASSSTTGIPRVVPLLDALQLPMPSGQAVAGRWATRRPYGLEATIGIGPDGPFTIDLVQQGPHALVAGTSGAGKSELLQTLVLALAVQYPPERLNFLFIDYKGGAASADFESLPHNVGSVTNLDERLSLRALVSLRAELRRRMELLEGRAKDLAGLLQVAPGDAPPSLVIVVDEFATLVKEIPDFVTGMVDIAQRGRSLGIHLVLATQRPTGTVNENILANTNLRIALRVLEPADSVAVIGAKDAAHIPVPLRGRAFARTGPGALSAFQCAWAGAPFEAEAQASPVVVRPFPFTAEQRGAAAGDGLGRPPRPTGLGQMPQDQLRRRRRARR